MQLLLSHELQIQGVRCLSPPELRGHVEERFACAVRQGQAVAALACEPIGLERVERRYPGLTPTVLGALVLALEPAFGAEEAIVCREERGLVVLLVGTDPKRMEAACLAWVGRANELRIDGLVGPLRMSLRIGYAVTQPGKRLFLDTVLQVARAGLEVARCRGAGACVHTMVYDVLQDRLERERGTQGLTVPASPSPTPDAPFREPEIGPATPAGGAGLPGLQQVAHGESREPRIAAPPVPASPPMRESVTDLDRRERELTESLDAQRRENDALRARLHALEMRDDRHGGVPRGTQETQAVTPGGAPDTSRIDLLERRLAKVMRSLAATEERLAQASRANAADPGIASCYRTVQGLEPDAPHRALKAALMKGIFEANLQLREHLRPFGQARRDDLSGLKPGR